MIKNKKTTAKAPAQARANVETAQTVAVKSVKPAARPKAKAAAAVPAVPQPIEPAPATDPMPPKIRLEISKPSAHSVAVAGSFNSWQPEQASTTGNGGWVKELTVGPGRYEYMFVVDGQWMADPNAKEFAPNPFGGQNSVLVV